MNIHNLKKMYNHILTVPEELLSMGEYRANDEYSHECNSVGCIIGHCVSLDSKLNIPAFSDGSIRFARWSESFTGIGRHSHEWEFIFGADWSDSPKTNSKSQILGRLKQFVVEYNRGKEFSWFQDYSYIVINPEYLDQTPFEL